MFNPLGKKVRNSLEGIVIHLHNTVISFCMSETFDQCYNMF